MSPAHRYLLIVACSQRKKTTPGLIPAIERYDGVIYRVLQKAKRDGYWPDCLDVLIISAKYGPIRDCTPIVYYEKKMTLPRAIELNLQILTELHELDTKNNYKGIFIDLGKDYIPAIEGYNELFVDSDVKFAQGRIGNRLKELKDWIIAKHEESVTCNDADQ